MQTDMCMFHICIQHVITLSYASTVCLMHRIVKLRAMVFSHHHWVQELHPRLTSRSCLCCLTWSGFSAAPSCSLHTLYLKGFESRSRDVPTICRLKKFRVCTRRLALLGTCNVFVLLSWPGASAELRSFAKQVGRGVPTSSCSRPRLFVCSKPGSEVSRDLASIVAMHTIDHGTKRQLAQAAVAAWLACTVVLMC